MVEYVLDADDNEKPEASEPDENYSSPVIYRVNKLFFNSSET